MQYGITRLALGCNQFVSIDRAEFDAVTKAKDGILAAFILEQRLDIVVENFFELEGTLLSAAARIAYFGDHDRAKFQAVRSLVDRRMANLLTAARLYFDQTRHALSELYGRDSAAFREFNATASAEYDSRMGYRALEEFRNHVQHQGMPVHELRVEKKRVDASDATFVETRIVPLFVPARLRGSGFKARILKELEAKGDKLDLREFVRDYLAGIGNVHKTLRTSMREDISRWDELIESVITRFQGAYGKQLAGIAVVERDEHARHHRSEQVFEELIVARRALISKNRSTGAYPSQFISSATYTDRQSTYPQSR